MIDTEFLSRFVIPPILGGIAGFFSPWLKHVLDNRNVRRDDRRAFIQKCKQDLRHAQFRMDVRPKDRYRDRHSHSGGELSSIA
jgi:hypothetical protein